MARPTAEWVRHYDTAVCFVGDIPVRVTVEWWTPPEPTHGTVEEEMKANGYYQCSCGKMHIPSPGAKCDGCGEWIRCDHGGCR